MSTYIDVASLADIPPGVAAQVEVNGQHIGIYNVDGTLYAMDDLCSHDSHPPTRLFKPVKNLPCDPGFSLIRMIL